MLLGAAGCGGDGEPEGGQKTPKDYKVVAGTELCGGNAISADASRALEVITGEPRFEASGERYTVEQAAASLVKAWPYPTSREDACRVYTPLGTSDVELRIRWSLVEYPTTDDLGPDFTVLKMGTLAGAKPESAFVRFSCRSERFPNQTQAANVEIHVRRWGMPKPVDGDDVDALKDAYATVAHSYSLAMAKELGCEKNGGLPEKAVLDRA
ncbi:hypothetical protein [Streptomyces sp. NPDC002640]